MGIFNELIDFNKDFAAQAEQSPYIVDYQELSKHALFSKAVKENKLVLNNMPSTTTDDRAAISRSIYTRYDNVSMIENVPTCECRHLKSRFNKGVICPECHSPVRERYDESLQSMVWIRAPKGIDVPLMNPMVLYQLTRRFNVGKFDLIRWLTDTGYVAPVNTPIVCDQILEQGVERGFSFFYKNFDFVMEVLFNIRSLRKSGRKDNDDLKIEIMQNREKVFCDFLPIPNKMLLVVEKTNFDTYIDPTITGAIDALWLMVGIDSEYSNLTDRQKENRTIKALFLLATFYHDLILSMYSGKRGLYRRQLFGHRGNFTFRTVISSITKPHKYNSIHVPWGVAISCLRYHLINKLEKRGWLPLDIRRLLRKYAVTYSAYIDQIFDELLAESVYGLPTTMIRNPSLEFGSIQLVYITEIKSDPKDITTSIGSLGLKSLNADFDGDQMSFTLMLDRKMEVGCSRLATHYNAFSLDAPLSISSNLAMPKTVISTFASWIYYSDKEAPDPAKRARMQSLLSA